MTRSFTHLNVIGNPLTLQGRGSRVWAVAFSPEGQGIVTSSCDRTAKVWQAASAAQVASWLAEEQTAAK